MDPPLSLVCNIISLWLTSKNKVNMSSVELITLLWINCIICSIYVDFYTLDMTVRGLSVLNKL
jgi:hypothetical protein